MSTTALEAALNDLSMALLEADGANAEQLRKEIAFPLEQLKSSAAATSQGPSIEGAIQSVLSATDLSADLLNRFILSVQRVVQTPEEPFTFSLKGSPQGKHPDFAETIDQELLIEFIEKHTTGLDEFEALLINTVREQTDPEEVSRTARGYIHNLKGDAGSLGINGIEKVCHFVEDAIEEHGVSALLEPLLLFKEWTAGWIASISKGDFGGEPADSFKAKLIVAIDESCGTEAISSQENTATAAADSDDMSMANMDLLAELLGQIEEKKDTSIPDEYPIDGDQDVFVEFVNEAEDHLGAVENTILDAGGSYNKDMIDTIFRGVHSIKGASSYFKLLEITDTSHHTESLLDEVRTGKRSFDPQLAELILVFVDLQRRLIAHAKEMAGQGKNIRRMEESSLYMEQLKAYTNGEKVVAKALSTQNSDKVVQVGAPSPKQSEAQSTGSNSKDDGKGEKLDIKNYVKVETDRLDHLIDAIGEMAIYSSMLIENVRQHQSGNEHLIKVTHQVEKFSRELQQIGMGMRLIPIRGLFQKMSRLVWDVARKIGKEVKFSMEGEDTELDRTIIEKLADPLMHMIRNAIDHGVEGPDEREASGKERAGKIELRAFHAGGNIHIQIIDDGRGLNPEKLIAKAREKGIISETDKLTDKEAYLLIFAAGFSTAAAVTDISGRGVGMDVVRRNIESMRGRVHIDSELNNGTTFTIELPLTLAIIDGISVGVGADTFIIPTLSVVEFMLPQEEQITRALDKGETYYFRGRYLPLYRLGNLFDIEPKRKQLSDSLVVVVENAGSQFALLVDEIISTHSTVIKSVGEMFSTNRGLAGCAIMPNGDIALILDLRSLLELAKESYSYDRLKENEKQRTQTMVLPKG